ncbi:MAG: hypothetical protein AAB866_02710, partial [Patescibacteria group bacterium]
GDVETETYNLPRELGNHLIDINGLKIHEYVDENSPRMFVAQFNMRAEELSALVEKTFDITMVKSPNL